MSKTLPSHLTMTPGRRSKKTYGKCTLLRTDGNHMICCVLVHGDGHNAYLQRCCYVPSSRYAWFSHERHTWKVQNRNLDGLLWCPGSTRVQSWGVCQIGQGFRASGLSGVWRDWERSPSLSTRTPSLPMWQGHWLSKKSPQSLCTEQSYYW